MAERLEADGVVRWPGGAPQRTPEDTAAGALVDGERGLSDRLPEGLIEDVTAHRQVREAVLVSELRYRRLFEAAKDGVLIIDPESATIEDVNPYLCDLLGFSRQELLGRRLWDIGPFQDVTASKASFRELLRSDYVRYDDLPLETAQGQQIAVEVVSNVYQEGERSVIQCNVRNITERKRLEQQQLQAQRLEALGRLAGGMAHEFNNFLAVILGYGEMVHRQLDSADPLREKVGQIVVAAEAAAGVTRQLLAFGRRQVLQPTTLDLNAVVTDLERMLRRLLGDDIEVVTRLEPGAGQVVADQGQLGQVLVNLILNARDAMPAGGRITIETRAVERDAGDAAVAPAASGVGPYAMLAVSDTGSGMDAATRVRIFDPFFTTKGVGKGSGLGLATVHGIVHESGGFVRVRSEVGVGTRFEIWLPRVVPGADAEPAAFVRAPGGGRETVLLVEDETRLRELVGAALAAVGYRVLPAGSGEEAVRLADAHEGRIDLLLTDVSMPGLSGPNTAELVTRAQPATKVLFMSGRSDEPLTQAGLLGPDRAFLAKPFRLDSLLRRVRELLDRGPAEVTREA